MKYSEGFKDYKIVHWEVQLKPLETIDKLICSIAIYILILMLISIFVIWIHGVW